MKPRAVALSALATAALVALAAWLLELSLERAVLLAPVLVVGAAAVAGLAILWTRVALQSLRRHRRPFLLVGLGLAFAGLLAVLTVLGIQLPRE